MIDSQCHWLECDYRNNDAYIYNYMPFNLFFIAIVWDMLLKIAY